MIDHIWTIICSRAIIDKRSNNVSAQNILEQIKINDIPKPDGMLMIPIDVVTLWTRSEINSSEKAMSRLSFVYPSGEISGSFESEINLLEFERTRDIAHFDQLPIREAGRHYFRIELKLEDEDEWQLVTELPIILIFEPPEDNDRNNKPEALKG